MADVDVTTSSSLAEALLSSSCLSEMNNYTCSDKGLLLPIINEYGWPLWLRALLYLIGMLWCFLGIAIIADIFMCAIEKITSKTKIIKVASSDPETIGYEDVEVKVGRSLSDVYCQQFNKHLLMTLGDQSGRHQTALSLAESRDTHGNSWSENWRWARNTALYWIGWTNVIKEKLKMDRNYEANKQEM